MDGKLRIYKFQEHYPHETSFTLQVLDELFKGAHVEGKVKVSPSAATPSEVCALLSLIIFHDCTSMMPCVCC